MNGNLAFLHNHLMIADPGIAFGRGWLVFDPTGKITKVHEIALVENPLLRAAIDYDGKALECFAWRSMYLGASSFSLRQVSSSIEVNFDALPAVSNNPWGNKKERGWKTDFYRVREDIAHEDRWDGFVDVLCKTFPIVNEGRGDVRVSARTTTWHVGDEIS